MTPPGNLPLRKPIPAEPPPDNPESRFIEEPPEALAWNPDQAPPGRLAEPEGITVRRRGVTPQNEQNPRMSPEAYKQSCIWRAATIHKNTVAAKLRVAGKTEEAFKLETCHTEYTIATCGDCGRVTKFPNRCDLFYCPECAAHLQNERAKQVRWWTQEIHQPKHVVLTVRNVPDLTPEHVDQLRGWFTRLRRRKFARNWSGGFYGIQVTNRNHGWHLHLHALINAKWIDEIGLRDEWREITGNMGYNVHVSDAREESYLRELTKYVVHGAQLAAWTPDQLATYLDAFTGKRTFGVFGSLYSLRTKFAEWIAVLKQLRAPCECGSHNIRYESETDALLRDLRNSEHAAARPPPAPLVPQLNLLPEVLHCVRD